jgi:hypothetical protein
MKNSDFKPLYLALGFGIWEGNLLSSESLAKTGLFVDVEALRRL